MQIDLGISLYDLLDIAEKHANLAHEGFDGNIDLHYKAAFVQGYIKAIQSIKNKVTEENKPTPEIPIDDLRYLNNL